MDEAKHTADRMPEIILRANMPFRIAVVIAPDKLRASRLPQLLQQPTRIYSASGNIVR